MVQGTTSDAGKSVLVTGLCRVLARRGVRVAPFKPQNMALNSAVTAQQGEIGRAQALQAQAAGVAPHTDMNPVLLKPSSDTRAQIIIHGRVATDMDAKDYHQYKRIAMGAVMESWGRLQAQYDCVVVEGAGSPAEINLRDRDIANMGFALAADCPVIIVADIDRGGVFAHLIGTLQLLSPEEQALVQGFVINRFRGDPALLQSGLDWLEQATGKPVLGVLPYLSNLRLDAEDAIAQAQVEVADEALQVIVPVLPRISNHTDFDPLRTHPQVNLTYIGADQTPPPADLIILPGSKNVRADLDWLRANRWHHHIARHLRYGGKLLGICGGYQMLGQRIDDPEGVEDSPGSSDGLALLPVSTRLTADKTLRRVISALAMDGSEVSGYEIHCGETTPAGDQPPAPFTVGDQSPDHGALSADGQVAGSYLHGLFDNGQACATVLEWAGLSSAQRIDRDQLREGEIDRVADMLEAHLDLGAVLGSGYNAP